MWGGLKGDRRALMAQDEPHNDKPTMSATPIFAAFGEAGKQRAQMLAAAQSELLAGFQELNKYWVARAKSEADLTSDLLTKLMSTRSIPEGATAYQEWSKRRMEMAVQDGQRLFADGIKLMETSVRLFSNGRTEHST
jgi:hypothetical protein